MQICWFIYYCIELRGWLAVPTSPRKEQPTSSEIWEWNPSNCTNSYHSESIATETKISEFPSIRICSLHSPYCSNLRNGALQQFRIANSYPTDCIIVKCVYCGFCGNLMLVCDIMVFVCTNGISAHPFYVRKSLIQKNWCVRNQKFNTPSAIHTNARHSGSEPKLTRLQASN